MQSASSRVRTRVAVSISYNDNHYTMGTSTESPVMLVLREMRITPLLPLFPGPHKLGVVAPDRFLSMV